MARHCTSESRSHGDPVKQTDGEYGEQWSGKFFKSDLWYQGLLTWTKYEHGQATEIRLYPVDLGTGSRQFNKGTPRMASPAVAKVVLERLQKLSEPFGTRIEIQGSVGVIKVAGSR